MPNQTNEPHGQDKANLRAALLGPYKDIYEKRRAELIERLGYDGFWDLQHEIFVEIGKLEETYDPCREL